jgi:hypothetical protein
MKHRSKMGLMVTVPRSYNSKNSDQTPNVLELTKSVQYSSVISVLLASHQIQPVA